jgi:hypothetical protein
VVNLDRTLFLMRMWRRMAPLRKLNGTLYSVENYYRNLLVDSAAARCIKLPPLYPAGSGANYSLLNSIFRACFELPITKVLEFGAGQSSLLLDSIASQRREKLTVTTLEEDPNWAEWMGRRVSHEILLRSLEQRTIRGRSTLSYSGIDNLPTGVDLLIIDGPKGTARFSRWAGLEAADRCLSEEFLIIFDDADRKGEQDTIRELLRTIRKPVGTHRVFAAKSQFLVFSDSFRAAAYF